MGLTPQQALCTKYIYYAVFNDDLTEYYGLTSEEDKEIIEKYHPNKFIFKEIDLKEQYINCELLENRLDLQSDYQKDKKIIEAQRLEKN